MLLRSNRILMALWVVVGLASPALAQQASPCDSFTKNGDGDWVATRDATISGPSGPEEIKDGNIASDKLQEWLDTQCR
jgi:hypothetical protein